MLESVQVKDLIRLAIAEDLGFGDITSELTVSPECMSRAEIVAKQKLLTCGGEVISEVYAEVDRSVEVNINVPDGQEIEAGVGIATVAGATRSLLAGERIVLNFLQRLSGIATWTRRVVQSEPDLVVLDTRKTTPGWRVLEKYAVAVGGGEKSSPQLG